jgi:hypothetical protein
LQTDSSLLLKYGGKYSLLFFKRSPEKNESIIFDRMQQKRNSPVCDMAAPFPKGKMCLPVKQSEVLIKVFLIGIRCENGFDQEPAR